MEFLERRLDADYRWRDLPTLGVPLEKWMEQYPCKSMKPWEPVLAKMKVGIEVEVERVQGSLTTHMNTGTIWFPKEDGSLRNGGREFVSIPLSDQMIPYAVHWLLDEYLPKSADFSERTSEHVHANVRTWSHGDILNLMLLYIVFEKILYKFAGPARYKNIFCVPIQETKLPVALSDFLVNHSFPALLGSWSKYSGLNLLPIKSQGSVEFRHMEGQRDPRRLLNWINIIQRLMKSASRNHFTKLFNTIRVLNTTSMYEQFLHDMFQEQAKLLDTTDLKRDMEYGVSVVKAVREPSPFMIALLEGISNDSPLLKSLGLSERESKKPKANKKEEEVVNENPLINQVAGAVYVNNLQQIEWDNNGNRFWAQGQILAQEQQAQGRNQGQRAQYIPPAEPYDWNAYPDQRLIFDVRNYPAGVFMPVGFVYQAQDGNYRTVAE